MMPCTLVNIIQQTVAEWYGNPNSKIIRGYILTLNERPVEFCNFYMCYVGFHTKMTESHVIVIIAFTPMTAPRVTYDH